MIDLYIRAFSRARWDTFAANQGITAPGVDLLGNTIVVVQPGFVVDHIGNFQLTDGVYDNATFPPTVITPPTFDTWHSVNLRIHGAKFLEDQDTVFTGEDSATPWRFIRSKIAKFVREQATLVNLPFRGDTIRAYQFGTGDNRLQLLDPRDITFPRRQWLGGMAL
jgi:hypothetical protein